MREDWVYSDFNTTTKIIAGTGFPKNIQGQTIGHYAFYKVGDISKNVQAGYRFLKFCDNYVNTSDIVNIKGKLIPKGSVVFAKIGEALKLNRRAITNSECLIDNNAIALKARDYILDNLYLYFYLLTIRLDEFSRATTVPSVRKSDIEDIKLPLPPLLEQKAIVAKIEQLFSELDNGVANLKTAKAKLKIYRQAVLKKAFEGELTKEWREKQTNLLTADELLEQIKKEREVHYKQQLEEWKQAVKEWEENGQNGKKPSRISKPKILEEVTVEEIDIYGKLPVSWKWERFNNVTHKIGDIDHKMPKPYENGIPYLSTGNIYADGTMDFENAKTISEEDYKRLALKIKPEKDDIIFPRYGTIGRNILVNIDKKFLVSYSCAIIKNINKYINAKYAHYYSLSPVIKKEIKRYTVQTTQANIGIASIENFVFPLCSLEEQNQIVQEIESRLSVCDKIEETIKTSLAKSEALRQSILKKAFEGKLLSEKELENIKNHPEYESAEELLKRIKKEREQ